MQLGINQHRFGVNYTPTRNWWYCWNDFDADAIARDLDAIAALEADHIRIMLIWPYFQPNPASVSEAHLERLQMLMRLARERSLDVCVSALVGWLSGYAFLQPFKGSFYTDARIKGAQELYFAELARILLPFDNFLGFDLGNEINCCWQGDASVGGDAWHSHFMNHVQTLCPKHVHVNGVDHQPWFGLAPFSPALLARSQSIVTLHCWTYFTGALKQAGGDALAPASTGLLASMAALARSYAADAKKPVWIQEFGMTEDWMLKAEIPRFLEETTLQAIRQGVAWFTWWASHDLDRSLAFDPLEYSLGLISHDNRRKPQGDAFRELARAHRGKRVDVKSGERALRPPPVRRDADTTWKWLLEA